MHPTRTFDMLQGLKKVTSDIEARSRDGSADTAGEINRELGSASNNMMLRTMCSESKRMADVMVKGMKEMSERMQTMQASIDRLCDLMETQIMVSSEKERAHVSSGWRAASQTPQGRKEESDGPTQWHYQGTRLMSKYKVITCIIFHLMEMVRLHLDIRGMSYPDSVDSSFNVVESCLRECCKGRCSIEGVTFKDPIEVPDFGHNTSSYNTIVPIIASKSPDKLTMLPEGRLHEIVTPATRPIMEAVYRCIERIKYLNGLLSPLQIDILASIRFPFVDPSASDRLNWDISSVRPRTSNPMSPLARSLPPVKRGMMIKRMMQGCKMVEALTSIKDCNPSTPASAPR